MLTLKVPKFVHVVKCNNKQMFGSGSSAFCFYDKHQAETVTKHLERSQNMTIWNTDLNPTKFLLHPNKTAIGTPRHRDYKIVTMESEPFFKDMLTHNVSIRLIDNVIQIDDNTCSLSSFCGIDAQPSQDETREYLSNIFNIDKD